MSISKSGLSPRSDERDELASWLDRLTEWVNLLRARLRDWFGSNRSIRLERFSRRLVDLQEKERRRIALEPHDEIGHTVTALDVALDPDDGQLDAMGLVPTLHADAQITARMPYGSASS